MMDPKRRAWYSVAGGVVIEQLITSIPGPDVPVTLGHPWDWCIHATMYGGLSFLIVRAVTLSGWTRRHLVWWALMLSAYGALDELHQLLIPGRGASAADWAFDTLGLVAGLFIGSWLMASRVAKWLR
jgi:VanZ family protein